MRRCLFHLEQNRFHLRGKHINTTDNKHIVRPAEAFPHPHQCPPAIAFIDKQPGKVSCAIAKKRHCFFGYGSENELAEFAVRKHFQCFGIDDFRDKMVFKNMVPVLTFTLHGYPRADNFAQTIYIVRLYV
ncbi:hypothetical protein SDC9_155324 [bioreactor metagenome]|uniref:Uncharacterized protein n=1 Tax=bioreactor metagenome TaxID=1076179 RepID=A0A645F147_9ZZZZ